MSPCRWLRWKLASEDRLEGRVEWVFHANLVPYSCLKTCEAWGPDQDLAAPERCGDARRSCYQAGPPPLGGGTGRV